MDVLAEDVNGRGFVCTEGSFCQPQGLMFRMGNNWDNAHSWLPNRVQAPVQRGCRPPHCLLNLRRHFLSCLDLVRVVQFLADPTRVAH
jgi:hypothetical protein